ncbi:MAG: ribonuclease domain-containing protein [Dermatophilaceae bacterium]
MTTASRASARSVALVVAAVLAVVLLVVLLPGGGGGNSAGPSLETTTSTARPTAPGGATASALPSPGETPTSGLPEVAESRLPGEAADTLALVRAGGPYPYEQDDGVFGNRERLLPRQPRGYYREYTVETPGEDDRGPRRLVVGEDGDIYWTTDHYASFQQVEAGR